MDDKESIALRMPELVDRVDKSVVWIVGGGSHYDPQKSNSILRCAP